MQSTFAPGNHTFVRMRQLARGASIRRNDCVLPPARITVHTSPVRVANQANPC